MLKIYIQIVTNDQDYIDDETRDIGLKRRNDDRQLQRKQNRVDVDVNLLIVTDVNKVCRC